MPAQHTHMDHISMMEHNNVSAIPRVHKKRPTALCDSHKGSEAKLATCNYRPRATRVTGQGCSLSHLVSTNPLLLTKEK